MTATKCHPERKHYGRSLCASCYQREWQKRDTKHRAARLERKRNGTMKRRYGIAREQYIEMFDVQSGQCKICGCTKRLVIDHDHVTKEVRGLLCDRCNTLCGYLETDKGEIQKAKEYLNVK